MEKPLRKRPLVGSRRRWEVDEIGLVSCLMADFGISCVEFLGSATDNYFVFC